MPVAPSLAEAKPDFCIFHEHAAQDCRGNAQLMTSRAAIPAQGCFMETMKATGRNTGVMPDAMTTPEEAASAIREMLAVALKNHREAVLTTVDVEGRPHAAWMGTVSTPDFVHLITLTGAHTDKVANIRSNPNVEWMFTSTDRGTIIYFEGHAEILVDEEMKSRYFQLVPEESRGFFMKHYRSGGEWCVIKTHIDSAVYCMPGAYTKVRLGGDQIRVGQIPSH